MRSPNQFRSQSQAHKKNVRKCRHHYKAGFFSPPSMNEKASSKREGSAASHIVWWVRGIRNFNMSSQNITVAPKRSLMFVILVHDGL